jgi:hypothetical protein
MPRKRKKHEDYVEYIVRIEDWDWALSFGLEDPKWSDNTYMDFRHLEIDGTLLYPKNFKRIVCTSHFCLSATAIWNNAIRNRDARGACKIYRIDDG